MSGSGSGSGTEAALEELYGASPDEFIARRDALAKERKAAGDAAGGADLKKRRRPTQIAWVLNQFARRRPDDVAEFADVGRELLREQRKALRGEGEGGDSFRRSIARQRDVVKRSLERLGGVMKELGVDPSAHRDELASVVRSAIVDPAIALALEEGRLEKVPEVATGFGGLGGLGSLTALSEGAAPAAPSKPASKAPSKAAAPPKSVRRADEKADRKAVEEAEKAEKTKKEAARAREREEREREKAAAEAAREEARAKREAQRKAIHDARAELHAAEVEAKRRQAAADEAERAARRLAAEAAESAGRVTEARRVLARAEASV